MAKRSDIEAQIAALQKELESSDEDTELWVEHDRGGRAVRTKLSGNHAKSWLDELFGTGAKDDEGDAGDDASDEDDGVKKDKMPEGGYFSKRKTG